MNSSEVIIVSCKDKGCIGLLNSVKGKIIVDLIGLGKEIEKKDNYYGINW